MKRTSSKLAVMAIAAAAVAPATAAAVPLSDGSDGHPNAFVCGKDYSRNSVSGDYCVRRVPSSVVAPVSTPPAHVTVSQHGFAWGDAFAGAGAAVAIAATGVGAAGLRRRRRSRSVSGVGHRPLAG